MGYVNKQENDGFKHEKGPNQDDLCAKNTDNTNNDHFQVQKKENENIIIKRKLYIEPNERNSMHLSTNSEYNNNNISSTPSMPSSKAEYSNISCSFEEKTSKNVSFLNKNLSTNIKKNGIQQNFYDQKNKSSENIGSNIESLFQKFQSNDFGSENLVSKNDFVSKKFENKSSQTPSKSLLSDDYNSIEQINNSKNKIKNNIFESDSFDEKRKFFKKINYSKNKYDRNDRLNRKTGEFSKERICFRDYDEAVFSELNNNNKRNADFGDKSDNKTESYKRDYEYQRVTDQNTKDYQEDLYFYDGFKKYNELASQKSKNRFKSHRFEDSKCVDSRYNNKIPNKSYQDFYLDSESYEKNYKDMPKDFESGRYRNNNSSSRKNISSGYKNTSNEFMSFRNVNYDSNYKSKNTKKTHDYRDKDFRNHSLFDDKYGIQKSNRDHKGVNLKTGQDFHQYKKDADFSSQYFDQYYNTGINHNQQHAYFDDLNDKNRHIGQFHNKKMEISQNKMGHFDYHTKYQGFDQFRDKKFQHNSNSSRIYERNQNFDRKNGYNVDFYVDEYLYDTDQNYNSRYECSNAKFWDSSRSRGRNKQLRKKFNESNNFLNRLCYEKKFDILYKEGFIPAQVIILLQNRNQYRFKAYEKHQFEMKPYFVSNTDQNQIPIELNFYLPSLKKNPQNLDSFFLTKNEFEKRFITEENLNAGSKSTIIPIKKTSDSNDNPFGHLLIENLEKSDVKKEEDFHRLFINCSRTHDFCKNQQFRFLKNSKISLLIKEFFTKKFDTNFDSNVLLNSDVLRSNSVDFVVPINLAKYFTTYTTKKIAIESMCKSLKTFQKNKTIITNMCDLKNNTTDKEFSHSIDSDSYKKLIRKNMDEIEYKKECVFGKKHIKEKSNTFQYYEDGFACFCCKRRYSSSSIDIQNIFRTENISCQQFINFKNQNTILSGENTTHNVSQKDEKVGFFSIKSNENQHFGINDVSGRLHYSIVKYPTVFTHSNPLNKNNINVSEIIPCVDTAFSKLDSFLVTSIENSQTLNKSFVFSTDQNTATNMFDKKLSNKCENTLPDKHTLQSFNDCKQDSVNYEGENKNSAYFIESEKSTASFNIASYDENILQNSKIAFINNKLKNSETRPEKTTKMIDNALKAHDQYNNENLGFLDMLQNIKSSFEVENSSKTINQKNIHGSSNFCDFETNQSSYINKANISCNEKSTTILVSPENAVKMLKDKDIETNTSNSTKFKCNKLYGELIRDQPGILNIVHNSNKSKNEEYLEPESHIQESSSSKLVVKKEKSYKNKKINKKKSIKRIKKSYLNKKTQLSAFKNTTEKSKTKERYNLSSLEYLSRRNSDSCLLSESETKFLNSITKNYQRSEAFLEFQEKSFRNNLLYDFSVIPSNNFVYPNDVLFFRDTNMILSPLLPVQTVIYKSKYISSDDNHIFCRIRNSGFLSIYKEKNKNTCMFKHTKKYTLCNYRSYRVKTLKNTAIHHFLNHSVPRDSFETYLLNQPERNIWNLDSRNLKTKYTFSSLWRCLKTISNQETTLIQKFLSRRFRSGSVDDLRMILSESYENISTNRQILPYSLIYKNLCVFRKILQILNIFYNRKLLNHEIIANNDFKINKKYFFDEYKTYAQKNICRCLDQVELCNQRENILKNKLGLQDHKIFRFQEHTCFPDKKHFLRFLQTENNQFDFCSFYSDTKRIYYAMIRRSLSDLCKQNLSNLLNDSQISPFKKLKIEKQKGYFLNNLKEVSNLERRGDTKTNLEDFNRNSTLVAESYSKKVYLLNDKKVHINPDQIEVCQKSDILIDEKKKNQKNLQETLFQYKDTGDFITKENKNQKSGRENSSRYQDTSDFIFKENKNNEENLSIYQDTSNFITNENKNQKCIQENTSRYKDTSDFILKESKNQKNSSKYQETSNFITKENKNNEENLSIYQDTSDFILKESKNQKNSYKYQETSNFMTKENKNQKNLQESLSRYQETATSVHEENQKTNGAIKETIQASFDKNAIQNQSQAIEISNKRSDIINTRESETINDKIIIPDIVHKITGEKGINEQIPNENINSTKNLEGSVTKINFTGRRAIALKKYKKYKKNYNSLKWKNLFFKSNKGETINNNDINAFTAEYLSNIESNTHFENDIKELEIPEDILQSNIGKYGKYIHKFSNFICSKFLIYIKQHNCVPLEEDSKHKMVCDLTKSFIQDDLLEIKKGKNFTQNNSKECFSLEIKPKNCTDGPNTKNMDNLDLFKDEIFKFGCLTIDFFQRLVKTQETKTLRFVLKQIISQLNNSSKHLFNLITNVDFFLNYSSTENESIVTQESTGKSLKPLFSENSLFKRPLRGENTDFTENLSKDRIVFMIIFLQIFENIQCCRLFENLHCQKPYHVSSICKTDPIVSRNRNFNENGSFALISTQKESFKSGLDFISPKNNELICDHLSKNYTFNVGLQFLYRPKDLKSKEFQGFFAIFFESISKQNLEIFTKNSFKINNAKIQSESNFRTDDVINLKLYVIKNVFVKLALNLNTKGGSYNVYFLFLYLFTTTWIEIAMIQRSSSLVDEDKKSIFTYLYNNSNTTYFENQEEPFHNTNPDFVNLLYDEIETLLEIIVDMDNVFYCKDKKYNISDSAFFQIHKIVDYIYVWSLHISKNKIREFVEADKHPKTRNDSLCTFSKPSQASGKDISNQLFMHQQIYMFLAHQISFLNFFSKIIISLIQNINLQKKDKANSKAYTNSFENEIRLSKQPKSVKYKKNYLFTNKHIVYSDTNNLELLNYLLLQSIRMSFYILQNIISHINTVYLKLDYRNFQNQDIHKSEKKCNDTPFLKCKIAFYLESFFKRIKMNALFQSKNIGNSLIKDIKRQLFSFKHENVYKTDFVKYNSNALDNLLIALIASLINKKTPLYAVLTMNLENNNLNSELGTENIEKSNDLKKEQLVQIILTHLKEFLFQKNPSLSHYKLERLVYDEIKKDQLHLEDFCQNLEKNLLTSQNSKTTKSFLSTIKMKEFKKNLVRSSILKKYFKLSKNTQDKSEYIDLHLYHADLRSSKCFIDQKLGINKICDYSISQDSKLTKKSYKITEDKLLSDLYKMLIQTTFFTEEKSLRLHFLKKYLLNVIQALDEKYKIDLDREIKRISIMDSDSLNSKDKEEAHKVLQTKTNICKKNNEFDYISNSISFSDRKVNICKHRVANSSNSKQIEENLQKSASAGLYARLSNFHNVQNNSIVPDSNNIDNVEYFDIEKPKRFKIEKFKSKILNDGVCIVNNEPILSEISINSDYFPQNTTKSIYDSEKTHGSKSKNSLKMKFREPDSYLCNKEKTKNKSDQLYSTIPNNLQNRRILDMFLRIETKLKDLNHRNLKICDLKHPEPNSSLPQLIQKIDSWLSEYHKNLDPDVTTCTKYSFLEIRRIHALPEKRWSEKDQSIFETYFLSKNFLQVAVETNKNIKDVVLHYYRTKKLYKLNSQQNRGSFVPNTIHKKIKKSKKKENEQ